MQLVKQAKLVCNVLKTSEATINCLGSFFSNQRDDFLWFETCEYTQDALAWDSAVEKHEPQEKWQLTPHPPSALGGFSWIAWFFCVHVYRVVILVLVETEDRGHAVVRVHQAMLQNTCLARPIAHRQTKIYFDNIDNIVKSFSVLFLHLTGMVVTMLLVVHNFAATLLWSKN